MFKTVEDLKDFILWAKDQKIQEVHVGKTVVVFSALALTEDLYGSADYASPPSPKTSTEEKDTSRTLLDEPPETAKEEEDLLFYSAR